MGSIFLEFSLVFGLAIAVGMVMRLLRQPAFLGYVLVGLIFSLFSWRLDEGLLSLLSSAGVMLLLFLIGLEINVGLIKELSRKIILIGLGQLVLTGGFFFLVFQQANFSSAAGLILALAFSFSSTIIVVKLLSEKHDLESLHGKIAVGILLIQDLAAILLLLFLNERRGGDGVMLILKTGLLILLTALISQRVMPRLLHRLSRSTDELILFSLAWCFIIAGLVASPMIGLSVEVGGFLAGLALSGSFEHIHIVNKIKPIRDFFLTIFFVSLGLFIKLDWRVIVPVMGLSLAVLVVKPVLVWALMRFFGYRQKAAFQTAILIGQTSEFSLILVNLMARMEMFSASQGAMISMTTLLTMVVSAYLIVNSEKVFRGLKPLLDFFYHDAGAGEGVLPELSGHVVLFGCHRTGRSVLSYLEKFKHDVLIVDHDPEVVSRLKEAGKNVVYGDVTDTDSYNQLGLGKAKLIISTVKDCKDSLLLLAEIGRRKLKVPVIVDAESHEEAEALYKAGAAYAVFPHFVSGLHLSELIKRGFESKEDFLSYKDAQEEMMRRIYD